MIADSASRCESKHPIDLQPDISLDDAYHFHSTPSVPRTSLRHLFSLILVKQLSAMCMCYCNTPIHSYRRLLGAPTRLFEGARRSLVKKYMVPREQLEKGPSANVSSPDDASRHL